MFAARQVGSKGEALSANIDPHHDHAERHSIFSRQRRDDSRQESEMRPDAPSTRKAELRSFLFLTVVMAPVLTVMIVGGYGFLVWMFQLVNGPPTY
jgi:nitrate reductase NapE